MFIKPAELPLPEELNQLGNDAFRAAKTEWDGWNAKPLTNSQLFQINHIVNALIAKALEQVSAATSEAMRGNGL